MDPNRSGRSAHGATVSFMANPARRGQGVGRALGRALGRQSVWTGARRRPPQHAVHRCGGEQHRSGAPVGVTRVPQPGHVPEPWTTASTASAGRARCSGASDAARAQREVSISKGMGSSSREPKFLADLRASQRSFAAASARRRSDRSCSCCAGRFCFVWPGCFRNPQAVGRRCPHPDREARFPGSAAKWRARSRGPRPDRIGRGSMSTGKRDGTGACMSCGCQNPTCFTTRKRPAPCGAPIT